MLLVTIKAETYDIMCLIYRVGLGQKEAENSLQDPTKCPAELSK